GTGASLDGSSVYLSALKENLGDSLALYADVITSPRFEDKEIERVRAQWLATIKQEKARPNSLARRLAAPLMYGEGHPYAIPPSGTGNEAGISSLTKADMQSWHKAWIRPENATLIVVGDTNLKEITPILEATFANWNADKSAAKMASAIPAVSLPAMPRVFLVNQPGAVQANILVGQLVPSSKDEKALDFEIANSVLGGEFSSRLNMNLRENKHWAYGSYSGVGGALGQRTWIASAAVQIDKTAESAKELLREITEYAEGKAPAKPEEVAKIQATEVRGLPGSFETANAVMGAIGGIIRYGRPDDYQAQRAARISALTPAQVNAQTSTIKTNALTWVIVGDLSKIEAGIRALNLGEVTVLDADGKPVSKPAK
ncbi:MAG: M16 family metallopeptidase, partial [Arenimonas sp.]